MRRLEDRLGDKNVEKEAVFIVSWIMRHWRLWTRRDARWRDIGVAADGRFASFQVGIEERLPFHRPLWGSLRADSSVLPIVNDTLIYK